MVIAALLLAASTQPNRIHVTVDGVDREAIVYGPSHRTAAKSPVLFAFHGHGGSPERMNARAHFETLWPEAVVVYPQGLPTVVQDRANNAPGWALEAKESNRDTSFSMRFVRPSLIDMTPTPKRCLPLGCQTAPCLCTRFGICGGKNWPDSARRKGA